MTITSPFAIFPSSRARSMSSSESKTLAGPSKRSPSLPVIFATAPPGARLPRRMRICPVSLMGAPSGATMRWPSASGAAPSRFSAIVWPVQVRQSPSIRPSARRYFMTAGTPPARCRSSMTYLPLGFRSAM